MNATANDVTSILAERELLAGTTGEPSRERARPCRARKALKAAFDAGNTVDFVHERAVAALPAAHELGVSVTGEKAVRTRAAREGMDAASPDEERADSFRWPPAKTPRNPAEEKSHHGCGWLRPMTLRALA